MAGFFVGAFGHRKHPLVVGHLVGLPIACAIVGGLEGEWASWAATIGFLVGLLSGVVIAAGICCFEEIRQS